MNTNFNKKDVARFGQHIANELSPGTVVDESCVDKWVSGIIDNDYRLSTLRFVEGAFMAMIQTRSIYVSTHAPVEMFNDGNIISFKAGENESKGILIDSILTVDNQELFKIIETEIYSVI